jgi:hypothetical protein
MEREKDRQTGPFGTDATPSGARPLPQSSELLSLEVPSSVATGIDNQLPSLGQVFGRSGFSLSALKFLTPARSVLPRELGY